MNAKKKGNHGENMWANWLISNGIKAWKDGGSGGGNREKSDVGNNINANFEVKTVKAINLKKAWAQSKTAADKTHNTPFVIVHFDGMPQDRWLVVMDNYDWLDLIKGEREDIQEQTNYENPQLKWAIRNLNEAGKKVLKLIEE